MKRSSLALSVLGVSILGCLAFSSTASAAASGTGALRPVWSLTITACWSQGTRKPTVKHNSSSARLVVELRRIDLEPRCRWTSRIQDNGVAEPST